MPKIRIISDPKDEIPNHIKHFVVLLFGWMKKNGMRVAKLNIVFLRSLIAEFKGYLLSPQVIHDIWSGNFEENYSEKISSEMIARNEELINILDDKKDVFAEGLNDFIEKETEKYNSQELEKVMVMKYLIDSELERRLKFNPELISNSDLTNARKNYFEAQRLLEDKSTKNIKLDDVSDEDLIAILQKTNYVDRSKNDIGTSEKSASRKAE